MNALDSLGDDLARLTDQDIEGGEQADTAWLQCVIDEVRFLFTLQPFWREGITVYAYHDISAGADRHALMEKAMASNFDTFHGWGPVFALAPQADCLVAMLRIPFLEAHGGQVVTRLRGVAQLCTQWCREGFLLSGGDK